MRVLIISDIHANKQAFDAVLGAAGEVDAVWCLGDLVGYGPNPNECIETVRNLPNLFCLLGNHDAAVLDRLDLTAFNREAIASVSWTRQALSQDNLQFLTSLPERIEVENTTLSHGSPRNPIWEYLLDLNTVLTNFSHFDTPACLVGHTHIPISYTYNGNGHVEWIVPRPGVPLEIQPKMILNPGSVGQPRDRDPRAAYAIYYPRESRWESHRVGYDIPAVQEGIFIAGLPHRHAARLEEGW